MHKLNPEAYEHIGAPAQVIEWLKTGVTFPFYSEPKHCYFENRIKNQYEWDFVDEQIQKLVKEGSVAPVDFQPHCTLALSCVPKKSKKLRLVLDCHPVNDHIDCPTFTQVGISGVSALIQENDDLFTLDIKSGFHHVPINIKYQTYAGFCWKNQFYVWTCLVFGISVVPYFFHIVVHPVVTFLWENDRIVLFVDDFLSMSQPKYTTDHQDFILNTFKELGWSLNWEKCELIPSKEKIFVGFRVFSMGSQGPWIKVLSQKIHKLKRIIKKTLLQRCIHVQQLVKVAGQCISMTKAVIRKTVMCIEFYQHIHHGMIMLHSLTQLLRI